ncbi:DUF5919 domain-containing protein [Plantactinospora sp. CA-294935]|uniref:DUF5919 domain-containing protein n=1 Tax=Plantactinospora sp. CA-294935 TaxID=3240012 RepID=UPI003D8CC506
MPRRGCGGGWKSTADGSAKCSRCVGPATGVGPGGRARPGCGRWWPRLLRIRDRLPSGLQECLSAGVYDETVRFKIVIVDNLCVTQPYLPQSRGVDAPAFVIRRGEPTSRLYSVFEQVFTSQWERSRQL